MSVVRVSELPSFTAIIDASGAAPLIPAAIPATAVPCPIKSLHTNLSALISENVYSVPL